MAEETKKKEKEKKISRARITLTGMLSLAVGRFRFLKNRPVVTDDAKLIAYVRYNPDFRVQDLSDGKAETKGMAPKKGQMSPPSKEKPADDVVPPTKPEPVTGDEDLEDGDPSEEESAPALTRKSDEEGGSE